MDIPTCDFRYWCGLSIAVAVSYFATVAFWDHYFSPLARIPGPFWASITRLWHAYHIFEGDHNTEIIRLHEQHGHFVRIAPDEVSVSHPAGPKLLLQSHLRKVCTISCCPRVKGAIRYDGLQDQTSVNIEATTLKWVIPMLRHFFLGADRFLILASIV